MTWEQIAIIIGTTILCNTVGIFIVYRRVSRTYLTKLQDLVSVVRDGMAERDAKFRKLQADIARVIVTDTRIFDMALEEDEKTEEQSDGRTEEDQD